MTLEDFVIHNRVVELMNEFGIEDEETFFGVVHKALVKRKAEKDRQQKYYATNKEKRDEYHKAYREAHPEYRAKNTRRAARG